MKLIDREGRLFGKISVVDVLAILLVAAMAAAMHSMVKARLLFDAFMVHSSFRGLTAPWS